MSLMPDPTDRYCTSHSTSPSALCEELERYTQENVPMAQMVSGPLVASCLGMLLALVKARRVLEIGCFTGYSALAMAERLPAKAELITIDVNPMTDAIARRFWAQSPHGHKIRSILKPALDALGELSGPFDLVFIDADKENYLNYLRASLALLSPHGVVVADNCLWGGRVLDPLAQDAATQAIRKFNTTVHEDPTLESCLLPVRDGLHVIRKRA